MSDMTDTDPTNTITADLATQSVTLTNRHLQVIGLFGSDDAPRALLRNRDGDVMTVSVGDTIGKGRVAAINAEKVIIVTGKHSDILRMPSVHKGKVAA